MCSNTSHIIVAYYSFIDSERIKGWVGLVGWPTADSLPINGYPSAAGPVQASESSPIKDRHSTTELHQQRTAKLVLCKCTLVLTLRILLTSWLSIPSSCFSLRWAARITPSEFCSSSSASKQSGWLQHVFVQWSNTSKSQSLATKSHTCCISLGEHDSSTEQPQPQWLSAYSLHWITAPISSRELEKSN